MRLPLAVLSLPWLFLACAGCQQGDRTAFRPQTAKIAIVTDRSDGIERGDGAACAAVATLARAALAEESPFGPDEALAGLGNNLDRNEPTAIELWGTASMEVRGTPLRLAEGRLERSHGIEDYDATVLQRRRRADAIAQRFGDECERAAGVHPVSPIYSALLAAVASLKNDCPPASECLLILQSDLVETVEPGLTASVRSTLRSRPSSGQALPAPIDLENRISVFFCGIAASTDVVSEAQRAQIVSLWRDKVLIHAERWVEQPLCPGYRPQL